MQLHLAPPSERERANGLGAGDHIEGVTLALKEEGGRTQRGRGGGGPWDQTDPFFVVGTLNLHKEG